MNVCATWNSATTRSATQRFSMNWCRGLWCRLRLSNTTRTNPLPSKAITKMTASTTTSATASRASRSHSVTLAPVGASENTGRSMDGYVSVITETDMLAGTGEEHHRKTRRRHRYEGNLMDCEINFSLSWSIFYIQVIIIMF